jgi:hypothetical protein
MNMKLASLVKRVENPEYTSTPVKCLPYGLAPRQARTYDHDPSLGYRHLATSNIAGSKNRDGSTVSEGATEEDLLEEDEWSQQNLRLKKQQKYERDVEVANLERYQKLRVLALRPAVSPLRPQSVSLLSPLNTLNNSVILPVYDDRLESPSTNQIKMDDDSEATIVPFENRMIMSVGQEQNVLPPYNASGNTQDLALVEEWATRMEAFLNKKYKRESMEFVEEAKLFYNSYFHETIRRVLKFDSNLGRLMTRVMKSYFTIFDHAINVSKKSLESVKQQHVHEVNELKIKYEKALKNGTRYGGRTGGSHLMAAALMYKKKKEFGQIMDEEMKKPKLLKGLNRFRRATAKMSGTIKLGMSLKKAREMQAMHDRAANGLFDKKQDAVEQDAEGEEDEEEEDEDEDETKRKRREVLHGNKFSGVDRNLEKLYDELTGNIGNSPNLTRFDGDENDTEWVQLSGATIDIAHFSAMAIPNVDLTHILNRGQRLRIGPKRFVINQEGDFYPSCIPLNEIWKGPAAENLPVYIDKKACHSKYDDDSDMEPDDDEEWRLVPATGNINTGEAVVFTSADLRGIIHRGSKIKIGPHLLQVGHYGTFSEDEFPVGSQWIGQSERNLPIYLLEEKDENGQEKKYDKEVEKKNEGVPSPWVILHGVTVNLKGGKAVAKSNADLRHVLQPGKLISLDHEVFTIDSSGDFTSTKIPLDEKWPHKDRDGVQIKIRRRDADHIINLLHASFRVLGIKTDKSGIKKDFSAQVNFSATGDKSSSTVNHRSNVNTRVIIHRKCNFRGDENGSDDGNNRERGESSEIGVEIGVEEPEEDYFVPNTISCQTKLTFSEMDEMVVSNDSPSGGSNKKVRNQRAHKTAADKAVNNVYKCVDKFKSKKRKNLLPKRIVLKTIALIIADKISADTKDINDRGQESMPQYLIDWFFHKYGMKKLADKQLARFVLSMAKIKKHPRVTLFQKLVGVHPSGDNLHQLADMKLAFDCLIRVKSSTLNGIHFLHEKHKKDHYPLECSMVVAYEMLRKQLVRSSLYAKECIFDQRTWPDLTLGSATSTNETGVANAEKFLSNSFTEITMLGHNAQGLEKVEEIRKFVFVKRALGTRAREDYKNIISKAVNLYTFIEKFVYLMKTSGQIEAEAARAHLRTVYIKFDEGLDGQISYDEFKVFVDETLGSLVSGFSKKKRMRMYKRALSNDDSGNMSEGSFMKMVDKYFSTQDLAELMRTKQSLRSASALGDENAEAESGEGPMPEEEEEDHFDPNKIKISMMDELDDNSGDEGEGESTSEKLKNIADYEIINDAWDDEKEIVDAHVYRLQKAKSKDAAHFIAMVDAFKQSLASKMPGKLKELWVIFRAITTMARREKAYQGLRTTLKVKKFAANLMRKTAQSKLMRLTGSLTNS